MGLGSRHMPQCGWCAPAATKIIPRVRSPMWPGRGRPTNKPLALAIETRPIRGRTPTARVGRLLRGASSKGVGSGGRRQKGRVDRASQGGQSAEWRIKPQSHIVSFDSKNSYACSMFRMMLKVCTDSFCSQSNVWYCQCQSQDYANGVNSYVF